MKILRNNATYPGMLNGLQVLVDGFTSTGGGAITVETHMSAVLFAKAFGAAGTVIDGVITNSVIYPGTKIVTFTAVLAVVYQAIIIGSNGYATTLGTVATTGAIDNNEVY